MVVIAKIRAKEEHAEELASSFRDMVAWVVENEPGTLTYCCNRSTRDPNEFVFFERYADQEAFQAHTSSPRFAELAQDLRGKLDGGMEMETLEEVAAKA